MGGCRSLGSDLGVLQHWLTTPVLLKIPTPYTVQKKVRMRKTLSPLGSVGIIVPFLLEYRPINKQGKRGYDLPSVPYFQLLVLGNASPDNAFSANAFIFVFRFFF